MSLEVSHVTADSSFLEHRHVPQTRLRRPALCPAGLKG